MAKTDPTRTLMKRLQKLEQAHTRLADVTNRIRAQADTIADLVRITEAQRTATTNGSAPATATPRRTRRVQA